MTRLKTWTRSLFNRETLREDAVAGLVLGVESVPDGLAGGLLAGVNPVFGLYAYMVGTVTGAFFTSATFMAVQATGAMAIVVSDVPAVHSGDDPELSIKAFQRGQRAEAEDALLEAEDESREDPTRDVVLVAAASLKELRHGYPNYFVDTTNFIDGIIALLELLGTSPNERLLRSR